MAEKEINSGVKQDIHITVEQKNDNTIGILSVAFGLVSIFFLGIVFVPLGLLFGIIALFKKNIGLGILGIFLSIIGIITSPSVWIVIAGAIGLSSL